MTKQEEKKVVADSTSGPLPEVEILKKEIAMLKEDKIDGKAYGPLTYVDTLREELALLKKTAEDSKKNHRASKPVEGRKYVLLQKSLASWGSVPDQQVALADIIKNHCAVGKEITEAELQAAVYADRDLYKSLFKSKQDVWYLFRYYRGLKDDGKHAGLVARGFIQQKG